MTTTTKNKAAAEAFVRFAQGAEAQNVFAQNGYRPVDPKLVDAEKFPTPAGLFTIDDLGG